MLSWSSKIRILVSALAADIALEHKKELFAVLAKEPDALALAQSFGSPKLIRLLRLSGKSDVKEFWPTVETGDKGQVLYQKQIIGKIHILYKLPIPGELQARLATESATDRFLEYLQKVYQVVLLEESDRHVRIFTPKQPINDFATLWQEFLEQVAFSVYGKSELQLPGLVQTFVAILNGITLSDRGFSTLDVPILTQEQADVLTAWYYAVIRDVEKRQARRQSEIDLLNRELEKHDLDEKEQKTKSKELRELQAMQEKEAGKYQESFRKSFITTLRNHADTYEELDRLNAQLARPEVMKAEQKKLLNQKNKLCSGLVFERKSVKQKLEIIDQSKDNPFQFIRIDIENNPEKYQSVITVAKKFNRTATDQINSTRGDIFIKCLSEMYRLLEIKPEQFDQLPRPLLTEEPILPGLRAPGDDSKEFCYSCGIVLDPKKARWQVLRFMFERPSQRRQSSSGEGRPHICHSCSALALASPLKVSEESVMIRLDPSDSRVTSGLKIKDYLRMLTNKEVHLSAGRYLILVSDRTAKGDCASTKLGQVQYALAKVASIFPGEVLADFKFSLVIQGSQVLLLNRHLLLVKGLMVCYGQSIVISGKDINMALGDAVRYVQQDLPFLAIYILAKGSSFSNNFKLEQVRQSYWKALNQDLQRQGETVDSNNQLPKRARLYRDVAALTGLTYAFAQSLEKTAKNSMNQENAEREVSKLIEKVDDAIAFSYYATLGDEQKTSVEARLYHNPSCDFIYSHAKTLLTELSIFDREREDKDNGGRPYLQFYADDISRAYQHFATRDYAQERDWKELTYNLKLSLYTRFPELVRKLKSTSETD